MSHRRNPHALLTPAMHSVIDRMKRANQVPLHALTPQQARIAYDVGAGLLELSPPALQRVTDRSFAARDGYAVPLRLYAPSAEKLPVLIYFHGGGFTIGSIATHVVHGFAMMWRAIAEARRAHLDAARALQHAFQTAVSPHEQHD